ELNAWRQILFRLGLTGLDPRRYGGLAFGNVSLRTQGSRFAVSGTQTGGKPRLGPQDYCLVTGFDLAHNRIHAEGPVKPSSEALSHGAVYAANRSVGCVLLTANRLPCVRRLTLPKASPP
ncbi:MAG: class II aldolase/adducin family protein, partial [Candidatus Methylumidiphilus sp.]